jgi:hypothetical protein
MIMEVIKNTVTKGEKRDMYIKLPYDTSHPYAYHIDIVHNKTILIFYFIIRTLILYSFFIL